MSMDIIGDFLTTIRNALMVYKRDVTVPCSKEKESIAQVLKNEGFIKDFKKDESEEGKPRLIVFLKYVKGESTINEITRISKPGRRKYEGIRNLTPVIGGLGISILSTNAGVITGQQAKKLSVGGEVICHVW